MVHSHIKLSNFQWNYRVDPVQYGQSLQFLACFDARFLSSHVCISSHGTRRILSGALIGCAKTLGSTRSHNNHLSDRGAEILPVQEV
jgi:hypothetical protein